MEYKVLRSQTRRPRGLVTQESLSVPNADTSTSNANVIECQSPGKTRRKKIPQKIFKCQECSFHSDRHTLLIRHIKIHSDIRPHQCHFCVRAFKTTTQLKTHISIHTGVKPYKCREDNCEKAFITSGELMRHDRNCHTHEKPFKCLMCDYASVEASHLRIHFRSHTGERPYKCDECGKAFIKNSLLKRHRMSHSGVKPYECTDCDQRFTRCSSLKSHITQQHLKTAPKIFCEICNTQLGRKSDLNVHMRKQHAHQEVPLQCRYCDKLFHDRWSLMQHQRTHWCYAGDQPTSEMNEEQPSASKDDTSSSKVDVVDTSMLKKIGGRRAADKTRSKKNPQKLFQCRDCSFYSDRQSHLIRHMMIHSDIRTHQCHFCERTYKTNTQLKTHISTHTVLKPYKCQEDNCGKSFITNGELTRHVKYCHTHEKSFKCTLCDYTSAKVSKLRVHLRSHTSERPYECDECGKSFIKNFLLKRHRISHTGEKPYKCLDCNQRFTQGSSLKTHITHQHLKTAPKFVCEICNTQLGKKSDLNVHMRKQHAHQDIPMQCRYCNELFHDRWSLMQHQRTCCPTQIRDKRIVLDNESNINKVTENIADSQEGGEVWTSCMET